MNDLSGKYLVDKIIWRGNTKTLSSGKILPSDYWFDVNMDDEFWSNNVSRNIDEDYSPREALDDFLWEYLDKVFGVEPISWRIRKLDEIREVKIDEILDNKDSLESKVYKLVNINKDGSNI